MDELAKLETERKRAADRVSAVEREWREAVEASRTASARVAEVERAGGSATSRRKPEEELVAAGGEEAPTLDRSRPPWNHLLGLDDDSVEDEVVDVAALTA